MNLPPLKSLSPREYKKTGTLGTFMYTSFVAGVFCILYSLLYVVSFMQGVRRDVVYLCLPIVIRAQMCREGGNWGISPYEYSCTHHVTRSPNKLWRSTSIFNLWFYVFQGPPRYPFQRSYPFPSPSLPLRHRDKVNSLCSARHPLPPPPGRSEFTSSLREGEGGEEGSPSALPPSRPLYRTS
jgi:hypothetical protein